MFKNILVSVSDKSGLAEFIKPMAERGARIVSTGGSAQFLREAGFKVVDVSEQTGFPEVMGGRVKTLHPHVHMGLLARFDQAEDIDTLQRFGIEVFDLVVVNLYPFEAAVKKQATFSELIEKIDVGGPSMLRAAAKNHQTLTVVSDPTDYKWIQEKQYVLNLQDRQMLAAKVFAQTATYDALISQELGRPLQEEKEYSAPLRVNKGLGGKLVQTLRYGENPHQQAFWYEWPGDDKGLSHATILQGKELSYNNILDLDASVTLLQNFSGPTCVAVKHNNPCGVATDEQLNEAISKCLSADNVSVFGGIVAINCPVSEGEAHLLTEIFLECIIAPEYTEGAKEIFAKKKNLRILEWPWINSYIKPVDIKSVFGGFVMQTSDRFSDPSQWIFKGVMPDQNIMKDLIFGERVCAALKSNAIAIVKNGQTLGLGMGQVNRIDAVAHAIQRYQAFHPNIADPVLVSDAFFPFPDSVEVAARSGIRWILQPGGSVKDQEVFAVAEKLGVNIIISGQRHFRH